MAKKKITEVVSELLGDYLEENGYELYNTEYVKEGRDWFLRVYVDLVNGEGEDGEPVYMGTEDCEKVSRYLSEKLDEEDPIEQNYFLEVSSPGMDRPLITPAHYERYVGSMVEVKLYKGIDGTKNIEGELTAFAPCEGDYSLKVKDQDGREWELLLSQIARTKLAVIF
ncbi:MAG: ribosome maturation factor RimP [Bacillota bacterium]|nr:ribosome maturation factor RimP [Bacillota bacterium]